MAVPRMCDPAAEFGAPVPISELAMVNAGAPRLSSDELTMYFHAYGDQVDLWKAQRNSLTEPFGPPTLLAGQSSPSNDYDPAVSADGLTLWFASTRVANEGQHLYVSTRASTLAEFGAPGLAATVNAPDTQQYDAQPFLTAAGNELWFTSKRTGGLGGNDIWRAAWTGSGFATPSLAAELNSPVDEWVPTLSADLLTVYFSSPRAATGANGNLDIWISHRNVIDDGFPAPTLVDELNTAGADLASWLSADNCRMYGASSGDDGTSHIYIATRQP
jgi:Tol biopolymer transport system component